ncbi:proton-conducting transporter transmembrane domain-containing protein [Pseudothermotoga thermarum]|uniref:NADH/Ubiquinone/plastoquinone (Complex I) n=1 Tax=Pseudothermotoga thermarum DSM 5069 TaxID=688269 RepID=F7YTZ4_9THEM|nr:proton-conducting transporter membrane subunit [Pseudothermotoga thermarum]AEH51576.1 NADH/Ubiquinone/plastoquinone (complex I) [Pseudothermotoga thermarum DSM 5069]
MSMLVGMMFGCHGLNMFSNLLSLGLRKIFKIVSGLTILLVLGFLLVEFFKAEEEFVFLDLNLVGALPFSFGILIDLFSLVFLSVLTIVYFGILMRYFDKIVHNQKRSFLLDFLLLSASFAALSQNYLQLLVGIELVAIAEVFLISDGLKHKKETVNIYLYFKFADALYITGALILFACFGSFDFLPYSLDASSVNLLVVPIALMLLLAGAFVKAAQFPFYEWLYNSTVAPIEVFTFIMVFKSGVLIAFRTLPLLMVLQDFQNMNLIWQTMAWVGTIGSVLAGLCALIQGNHLKLFAFSSASQYGLIFASLGLAGLSENPAVGLTGALFHLMTYSFSKSALLFAYSMRNGKFQRLLFLISVLVYTGLPFVSGTFWSKELILESALQAHSITIFGLMLISATLTVVYSTRLYFEYLENDTDTLNSRGYSPLMKLSSGLPTIIFLAAAIVENNLFGHKLEHQIEELLHVPHQVHHSALLPVLPILAYGIGISLAVSISRLSDFSHISVFEKMVNKGIGLISEAGKEFLKVTSSFLLLVEKFMDGMNFLAVRVFNEVSSLFLVFEKSVEQMNKSAIVPLLQTFRCLKKLEYKLNHATIMFMSTVLFLVLFVVFLMVR